MCLRFVVRYGGGDDLLTVNVVVVESFVVVASGVGGCGSGGGKGSMVPLRMKANKQASPFSFATKHISQQQPHK